MHPGREVDPSTLRLHGIRTAVALLAALACSLGCAPSVELRIVLITLDTLRYDSFEGGGEIGLPMPNTRVVAEQALVFRRSYAATSTTQPTHASIFTGLHPWQHGVSRNGIVLSRELDTVVERMSRRGFRTAAVVSSFPLHRKFGFDQGFDRFDDDFQLTRFIAWAGHDVPGEAFYSRAEHVTKRAIAQLDSLGGSKQFFWFHYFDAHAPYGDAPGSEPIELRPLLEAARLRHAGLGARIAQARRNYDDDIRYLDAAMGPLLDRLGADAESTETHIVIVSDHGESFGEDRALGHGDRLTPEQIHVPLVIVSPRVARGTSDVPVGSVDVAATLDALAGGTARGGPARDLTADPQDWAKSQAVVGMRSTFAEPWESIQTDGTIVVLDEPRFYTVEGGREYSGDSNGVTANDGSPIDPNLRAELRALFAGFQAELETGTPSELLDAKTQAALEALGYTR